MIEFGMNERGDKNSLPLAPVLHVPLEAGRRMEDGQGREANGI
jgi:hypothetical protein